MKAAYVRDFICSRYADVNYILKLPFSDFIEIFNEGIISQERDKLWLAYVTWNPEMDFSEFVALYGNASNNSNDSNDSNDLQKNQVKNGVYIDQIGFF